MKLKTLLIGLFILITFMNCGNEDDTIFHNPCISDIDLGVSGVTESNFMIQTFNEPDQKGYIVSATITNDNPESVSGKPSFVFREHGRIITYGTSNSASSTSCINIDAESTCDFEFRIYLSHDEAIDNNIEFLCFIYFK